MLNKNDPLIGAVQEVMKKNQAEREAAKLVNEKFGVHDRKALPHEKQGEWDAAYKTVLTEGAESLDEAKLSPEHKSVITQKLQKIHGKGKVKFGPNGATWSDGIDQRTHDVTVNKSGKVKMDPSPYVESQVEEEKSFAALAPPYDKATQKDRLVGAGVLKKHPTQPGKHILAKEEEQIDEAGMMPTGIKRVLGRLKAGRLANKYNNRALGDDPYQRTPPENYEKDIDQAIKYRRIEKRLRKEDVTSPSGMGIKGPDYATGTPDYAVRKTVGPKSDLIKKPTMSSGNSTVTQTGKTSSSATKSTMKESKTNPYAIGMAAVQKSTGDKPPMEKKNIKKAHKIAKKIIAKKKMNEGFNNRHGLSVTASAEKQAVAEQTISPSQNYLDQVEMRRSVAVKRQQNLAKQRLERKYKSRAVNNALGNTGVGQVDPSQEEIDRSNSLAANKKPKPVVTAPMAPKPADRPNDLGKAGVPGTGGRLAPAAVPKPVAKPVQATSKPAAAVPVKNASTRGGTMTQRNANLLARAKAGGGQRLSTTFKSGKDRLAFFAARNAERRGP